MNTKELYTKMREIGSVYESTRSKRSIEREQAYNETMKKLKEEKERKEKEKQSIKDISTDNLPTDPNEEALNQMGESEYNFTIPTSTINVEELMKSMKPKQQPKKKKNRINRKHR